MKYKKAIMLKLIPVKEYMQKSIRQAEYYFIEEKK